MYYTLTFLYIRAHPNPNIGTRMSTKNIYSKIINNTQTIDIKARVNIPKKKNVLFT